jgi:endonuclease YncB( thermonuclease family)
MHRMLRGLAPLLLCLVTACLAAPAAHASFKAPCVAGTKGPACTFWDAKAVFIADGDTIRVKLDDDPKRAVQSIRFTGINAMELHRYSKYADRRVGECHGLEATALVERAVRRSHWRVRVAAQRPSSVSGHRLRRSVWVKVGGHWEDLAKLEMEAGLALWLPNGVEWAHNLEYHALAEQAAAAQRGLYDPDFCGAGPDQDLPISLSVNWDADGNDRQNKNGEWVDIRNTGARPLPLAGWWLRDSWLNYDAAHKPGYGFPAGTVVPAGGTLRLHMGCGANSATELYWCQKTTVFENVTRGKVHLGDGGYLFDPQGDLRASTMYPCLSACSDPLAGLVRLSVHPTTPESITVTNVSAGPVDLGDHTLKLGLPSRRDAFIFGIPFSWGTVLQPGQSLVVDPGGQRGAGSTYLRFLGRGPYVLADGGGSVSLRTMTDMKTACVRWGRGRC